jgi:hypothetical protein
MRSGILMSASQDGVYELKQRSRNLAAWYAIIVPLIGIAAALILLVAIGGSLFFYSLVALIMISSFMAGIWSLCGKSVQGVRRGLVLVGMLVSGVCGGMAFSLCLLILLYYR